MKSTDNFKKVIEAHLQHRASMDPLFAVTLKKENKNIDDCITYILNTVHKSGCNGFTDDEVFGMAAHYYDEDNIEVGKPINARVVVNHKVEQPAPKKPEKPKSRPVKSTSNAIVQPSLFD
ncbi:PcfK-like family protein [Gaoshiqia sediminis]|uniref:PcfK-like family protein n=1 Tax=Gaoshiqia sediminis TaxID=2986998 RepID=A0AA41Y8M9_9BACT|nr:PcfK-like family protein [Gaoshiqia sediminis]MCW0484044.1 PcfK-like family protein [Gaoshiqia sediminis]